MYTHKYTHIHMYMSHLSLYLYLCTYTICIYTFLNVLHSTKDSMCIPLLSLCHTVGNRNDVITLPLWKVYICVRWSSHQQQRHLWYKSRSDVNPTSQKRPCSRVYRFIMMSICCLVSSLQEKD
jgi:hypothetical protein